MELFVGKLRKTLVMAVLGSLDSSHHHPAPRYPEITRKAEPQLPHFMGEFIFTSSILTSLPARRKNNYLPARRKKLIDELESTMESLLIAIMKFVFLHVMIKIHL